jgi:X-Pro dipeptidyl-peptidase
VLGLSTGGAIDSLTFTDANLSETNYLSLATSQANRLLFLSPPLTHDLRISGTPVVDIRASLSTTQSNLSAWLVDYGTGVLRVNRTSNEGVITSTTTQSCYGESTAADDACYFDVSERTTTPTVWRVSKGILDSSNRGSLFTGEALPAVIGQTYEFKWPTLPNDFTFPAGHQIGIVIGANFSGFGSVLGTRSTAIRVDTRASRVVLPVVGGYLAARGSGAFAPDTIAPTLHLPADITVDATSPAGAIVTYTATATDNEDPDPSVKCLPASGSTFPIGTTTVSCTATDASGNSSTGSFTVHVNGPTEFLAALLADVTGVGPGKSLADKVKAIQALVAAGKTADACSALAAFVNEVNAQAGKKVTQTKADALLAEAAQISALLAC